MVRGDTKEKRDRGRRYVGAGTLELRLVNPERAGVRGVRDYVEQIHRGGPWDVVVIDGPEDSSFKRMDCVQEAAKATKSGGMVILDDSYRAAYRDVGKVLLGWQRLTFRGLGAARLGVTQTDIWFAPGSPRHDAC